MYQCMQSKINSKFSHCPIGEIIPKFFVNHKSYVLKFQVI